MNVNISDGIYYEEGKPKHAGVVKVNGAIYYAGKNGVLATGEKIIHRQMGNGILKHGTYRFGEDGKLIKGYYIPPTKTSEKSPQLKEKVKSSLSSKAFKILMLSLACFLLLLILSELRRDWQVPTVQPSDEEIAVAEEAPEAPPAYNEEPVATEEVSETSPVFNEAPVAAEKAPELILPAFTEEQYLCTEPLRRFYRGEISLQEAIEENQGAYAPLSFSYQLPSDDSAVLTLDGKCYDLDSSQASIFIDNLIPGKTYDYTVKVTAPRDGGQTTLYQGHVTTAVTNRFVRLPGVQNTRDLGGYAAQDGKRVKQGMIIRGTELDGLVESSLFLTDKDAAAAFGFKTELDLRNRSIFSGDYQSRLGENVAHRFYNSPCYGAIYSKDAMGSLLNIFTALADPDNYPIYMHCTYGADRTGTIVYLLQAVLGVSDEDKELEYRLTGFYMAKYAGNTELNGIFGGLDSLPGDTINEKICGFLTRDVGVTEAQLDSIRAILLEEP